MERAGYSRTETNHAVGAALDETDSMLGNSFGGRALTHGIVSGEHPRIERSHHEHCFSRAGARLDIRARGGFPSALQIHVVEVACLTSKNHGRNVTVEMLRRISTKEPRTCFAAEGIPVATALKS